MQGLLSHELSIDIINIFIIINIVEIDQCLFIQWLFIKLSTGGSVDIDQPVGEGYYGDTAMNHGHDVTP